MPERCNRILLRYPAVYVGGKKRTKAPSPQKANSPFRTRLRCRRGSKTTKFPGAAFPGADGFPGSAFQGATGFPGSAAAGSPPKKALKQFLKTARKTGAAAFAAVPVFTMQIMNGYLLSDYNFTVLPYTRIFHGRKHPGFRALSGRLRPWTPCCRERRWPWGPKRVRRKE